MRKNFDFISPNRVKGLLTMDTTSFRFWDNIVGWFVFAIATISYWATMEPTTSLWDCSEYIATSYKLEVGHPPGAPLYMMLARIASLFAPSPEYVPLMINGMNSLVSGFTILFMFWTVTHLARRIVQPQVGGMSLSQMVLVLGAGAIGALSYAYTDTFWFSAVEGEVYAMSSMFTALVVWLMLKWEENADSPTSMRWIILIAYLMGLSIGVHILNLLTIPALVMIYFFRRFKMDVKWWKYLLYIVVALVVSMLILGVINGIIIPYTVLLGAYVDTFAVNTLGMPVNMGMVLYVLTIFTSLGLLIFYSHKREWRVTNIVALAVTVVLLGFSSYAMMTIRANANPPMNSNNPENPHMLLSVLNRDQYGARPLLKGTYYDATPLPLVEPLNNGVIKSDGEGMRYVDNYNVTENVTITTKTWYNPESGRYEERIADETEWEYKYPDEAYHYFPRMWYPMRAGDYASYVKHPVECEHSDAGRWVEPSRGDDVAFFFDYQMGDMFWRYFMWNFAGRQDDVQLEKSDANGGTYLHGGWLSGIDFIDEHFSGPQDNLPSNMQNNAARNTYFFLPLLLGLLGLIYQLVKDWRNWLVVMLLFVMMGIALVVYFNTAPNEPRERDYVYAGAFYAFSIWIGLGVLGIGEIFTQLANGVQGIASKLKARTDIVAASLAVAFSMSVPLVLAVENWDDHDRSERYYARDIGWNYLNTVPENAILINFGDNDTFPLWYCQEVEGVRPDVKVMNSSYLEGDWYIDQMRLASNEADGVPFTIPATKYKLMSGTALLSSNPAEYVDDKEFLELYHKVLATLDREYEFIYYAYDMATGQYLPAKMELPFTEVVPTCNKLYEEYVSLDSRLDSLSDMERYRLSEIVEQYSAIAEVLDGQDRSHPFYNDYNDYQQYCEFLERYCPRSLPLADAIAHYISDEPMWLIMNDDASRWRIVAKGSKLPEGYILCCTLYPKMDSYITGEPADYLIYADRYTIPVDLDAAIKAGVITKEEALSENVVEEVEITINSGGVSRGQLMMYDLLGNYDWSRPICFTQPHIMQDYGVLNYARFDGFSYTFVPIKTERTRENPDVGCMDIDKLYPLYMDECDDDAINQALRFGNLADEDVHADYFVRYNVFASNVMGNFARVANGFIERGGEDDLRKAETLLDRGLEVLPPAKLGYDYSEHIGYAKGYFALGEAYSLSNNVAAAKRCFAKGVEIDGALARHYAEWVNYYIDYLTKEGFTKDIASKLSIDFISMIDCLQLADKYDVTGALGLYDDVVKQCGEYNPEYIATKCLRGVDKLMPYDITNTMDAIIGAYNDALREDERKEQEQGTPRPRRYLSDFAPEEYFPVVYFLENMILDNLDLIDIPKSKEYLDARNALLVRASLMSLADGNKATPTAQNQANLSEQVSERVQKVLNVYVSGLEAWKRATEYIKAAVESMAPKLNMKINVEYQDEFQYFYAYSDYAQEMESMAIAKGVNIADERELFALSDEQYSLADEYLKMGDKAAIELVATCADVAEPLIERVKSGNYTMDDITTLHANMFDIIDVLDVSYSVAGSFDWVANDVGYNKLADRQVSFDELMVKFVDMANVLVADASTESAANTKIADIVFRVYSLLPRDRQTGYAPYIAAAEEYLNNPKVAEALNTLYR